MTDIIADYRTAHADIARKDAEDAAKKEDDAILEVDKAREEAMSRPSLLPLPKQNSFRKLSMTPILLLLKPKLRLHKQKQKQHLHVRKHKKQE